MMGQTKSLASASAPDNVVAARMRHFARAGCALVAVATILVMLGYVRRSPELVGLFLPGVSMSPVTAVALLSLCGLITLRSFERDGVAFAWLAGSLAFATIVSGSLRGREGISGFVARGLFDMQSGFGRVSMSTAICLLLLSVAASPTSDRHLRQWAGMYLTNLLSGCAMVVSGIGVLGYLYDARLLLDVHPYAAMSLPTAVCIFLLSLTCLAARPASGWAATVSSFRAGGAATRRQLVFTLLPLVVGALLIKAMSAGMIEPNSALALLVALTIVPLALLVLRDGAVLDLLDIEKSESVERQARMNVALGERLADQAAELELQTQERLTAEAALNRTQRLEAVGQLTGGIAHDFNNLLMAVKGNLDLMRRRLPAGHEVLRYIDNANAAATKGAKVTQQLLAFSRTQRLEIVPVRVRTALEGALELISRALGASMSVVLDASDEDVWVAADPDQLELALLNLAINSRDALHGNGRIEIRQTSRIRAAGEEGTGREQVVIAMIDEGDGMSPEVVARATEPFFTTKPQGKGTGLGLAQAYGFAKQCGGDLRIRSLAGRGTTIEIWLPCVAPPQIEQRPVAVTAAAREPVGRQRHVLVIDDDAAVRGMIVEALRDNGEIVAEASDGPSGLGYLALARPDVAVVDFIMPGMNGADVARAAQRDHPGLPIVFVSGYLDTLALDGITNSVVLRKPFELEALLTAIEDVVPA